MGLIVLMIVSFIGLFSHEDKFTFDANAINAEYSARHPNNDPFDSLQLILTKNGYILDSTYKCQSDTNPVHRHTLDVYCDSLIRKSSIVEVMGMDSKLKHAKIRCKLYYKNKIADSLSDKYFSGNSVAPGYYYGIWVEKWILPSTDDAQKEFKKYNDGINHKYFPVSYGRRFNNVIIFIQAESQQQTMEFNEIREFIETLR